MKFVVIGVLYAAALAAVGCRDGRGVPTSPSASTSVANLGSARSEGTLAPALSAAPRSGDLHVTKQCSDPPYTGQAGQFCTITGSNVKEIEIGSRVIYQQAAGATSLDSDVVLDPPGTGNNTAFGHCTLDLTTGLGVCTFSGGTGKFTDFRATARVSPPTDGVHWQWEGTYSFIPND